MISHEETKIKQKLNSTKTQKMRALSRISEGNRLHLDVKQVVWISEERLCIHPQATREVNVSEILRRFR